ncbi:hypothetical protein Bpfe_002340 [Biomphalaria pfeifferi]|uniref:Uncharacterized protein n=1 Tax=Biomphalaria pfeifferi TaxID=112525 RepID=A0AAD8FL75_BIOPF|nr:hypothetical protein Bpfe_002340 [Biomphalaria pfeifferi]
MTPSHGSYGHNFSSPEIMGSQDSVTVPYCLWRHTLFPRDHVQSRLRQRAIGPHIFFPRDHGLSILCHWCVLIIAIHTLPLRSWAVKGPYCLCPLTLFHCDQGQSRIRHRAIWPHIVLPRDHGLSILCHWCVLLIATHTLPLLSWAIKGPYCLLPHTLFHCDHGQSRLRHWAIWPLIFIPSPRSWAVNTLSLVRTDYCNTHSSTAIMGSQGAVLFMFTHHFPLRSWAVKTRHRAIWPLIFLPSPRSWAVNTSSLVRPIYCNTHSSTAIMGSQGAVLFMATHTLPLRLWAVKAPSQGHLAAHCPFPRSWAVNTPSLVRTVNCNTHSSTAIMGSQEAVLFVDTHTLQLRSWAVKTPLPGH